MKRRTFLQTAVGSIAAQAAFGAPNSPVIPPLSEFPYGAARLTGGPAKRQFDENHAFFLELSEDRMLKIYRQRAGLPAPGEDMGGWYDDFCPGAHFGQYLSALARFTAVTGSDATRAKVNRLVTGLGQTIDPTGKFFVDLRYPGYTYDKLVLALLDAHTLTGNTQAIPLLYATTTAARPHMPDHALTDEEKQQRPHKDETYTWDETYTMAENLFLAYERTNDRMFFDMGRRYLLDRTFFDPLSQGHDVLPGLHAYSHVNALSSGMQGYFKLGDPKYLRAVNNAVDMIWKDQSFATGGWGPNEAFVEPGMGELGKSLTETRRHFETPCGAYAHFKVMRYLLRLTRDSRYGDSMEQVMWNTVLGAKLMRLDGSSFYYSDYHPSAVKTFRQPIPGATYRWDLDARWPCCSGTLPQIASDYGISSYFRDRSGVYVNLYVPSRLTWSAGSVQCTLTQETNYPTEDLVKLRVETSAPTQFTLHLRIPAWAGNQTSVSINGKRLLSEPVPGTFVAVGRTWRSGDLVELGIDQPVRVRPVDPQTPDQVAIVRGSQVLFALSETQPQLTRAQLEKPILTRAGSNDWRLGDLVLRPFPYIGDEVYQTYSRVAS
jgi:hypothetical protein